MRVRKSICLLICLPWIVLTFFVSCGDKPKKKPATKVEAREEEAQTRPEQVERIDIPLDNPQGEVSLARNFYFIFDGSGSMRDRQAGRAKLEGAKEAVRKFLT